MQQGIRWTAGPLVGETHVLGPLGSELVLGRDAECNVQVLEKGVSRRHLRLTVTYRGVVLTDLESRNGTFVTGRKITEITLELGQTVTLGEAAFELVAGTSLASSSDDDIKLISGPAEQNTELVALDPAPQIARSRTRTPTMTTPVCVHPLHAQAVRERWKHCPECAAVIRR